MLTPRAATLASLALLAVAACGHDDDRVASSGEVVPAATIEEVAVTDLALGKRLRSTGDVDDATTHFGPRDALVAVVRAERAAPGQRLDARWTYGDDERLVADQTQTVAATTGDTHAIFALPPAPTWPPGTYRVRIMNGAKQLAERRFEVSEAGGE